MTLSRLSTSPRSSLSYKRHKRHMVFLSDLNGGYRADSQETPLLAKGDLVEDVRAARSRPIYG